MKHRDPKTFQAFRARTGGVEKLTLSKCFFLGGGGPEGGVVDDVMP
jgi:hypothetical protein